MFKTVVDFIFSLGLFFNAGLFIPQAIKIYKNRNVTDLSLTTFLGFNIMQFFTGLHGYLAKDYLLAFGFLLSFITCACVTILIFYFKKS